MMSRCFPLYGHGQAGEGKRVAVHHEQIDRYFFYGGTLKLVLYDDRSDSPTHGMINELYFSEANRSLVRGFAVTAIDNIRDYWTEGCIQSTFLCPG